MKKILDDVYLIQGIGSANVFLLASGSGFILIDSGIFMQTNQLIDRMVKAGFSLTDLKMIVLTHCHCDHIGGAAELVRQSNAKVAAHEEDIPFITQEKVITGPYHHMMIEEQKYMNRFGCQIRHVDITLHDGGVIDVLGGLDVISVPGHTPGSIALYQADRKIMFFGDVIRNNDKHGLTAGVPEKFNCDTAQTKNDARKLIGYPIDHALFSHGDPILFNASEYLSGLT